jgi:hypothetical protein
VDDGVDAVVLGGVGRIDVDGHDGRRLGLAPVLGVDAVEVAADRHDEVGLVPQRARLGEMRR